MHCNVNSPWTSLHSHKKQAGTWMYTWTPALTVWWWNSHHLDLSGSNSWLTANIIWLSMHDCFYPSSQLLNPNEERYAQVNSHYWNCIEQFQPFSSSEARSSLLITERYTIGDALASLDAMHPGDELKGQGNSRWDLLLCITHFLWHSCQLSIMPALFRRENTHDVIYGLPKAQPLSGEVR